MCYSGLCDFEAGGDRAGDCTAPRGFEQRYGVSPCMVGGDHFSLDEERWAEEHAEKIGRARAAYWRDRAKELEEARRCRR